MARLSVGLENAFQVALDRQNAGQLEEAERWYREILLAQPDFAEALYNFARLRHAQGDLDEALASFGGVLELRPDDPDVLLNLGRVHQDGGRLEEAREFYERALEVQPEHPNALAGLGKVHEALGRREQAADCYQRLLSQRPDDPFVLNSLGVTLEALGQYDEALVHQRRAVALRPDYADAVYNLGYSLQGQGALEEALTCYQRTLGLAPDHAEALWGRALARLASGDFAGGWPDYEIRSSIRLVRPAAVQPDLKFPMWRGESLAGMRLLVLAEQGYGDQIQFARYLAMLARQEAAVDVLADEPMHRLLRSIDGVHRVVTGVARDSSDYDFWTLLLSLPLRFGTRVETIPRDVPYFKPAADDLAKWSARLRELPRGHLKVGLVWAGSRGYGLDRFRSMALETLAPLGRVAGVSWVSLQTGAPVADIGGELQRLPLLDLGGEMGDFADTAALLANLDLMIAVDTAFAHLAGALARPVWLLQSARPDWRWIRGREDSPWYPTMRLMRQATLGDWTPVVARATRELASLAGRA